MLTAAFQALTPGDVVEVVAPGYGVTPETLEQVVTFLRQWGFVPHVQPYWRKGDHPLYAASDEHRLEGLKAALLSPQAKVIWTLRGGAGLTLLIPKLLAWAHTLTAPPPYKLFIGISDVTALHLLLSQEWGWPTLHGPTLNGIVRPSFNTQAAQLLKDVLFGQQTAREETDLTPLNEAAQRTGQVNAVLVGGNHSIIQYSLGTAWQIDTRFKILFLEDVNEQPYRIDLRLDHLSQSRTLEWVKAIIFGDFNFTNDLIELENQEKVNTVLKAFAQKMTVPVFRMPDYGHKSVSKPLLMGTTVSLKTGLTPSLTMNFTQTREMTASVPLVD